MRAGPAQLALWNTRFRSMSWIVELDRGQPVRDGDRRAARHQHPQSRRE